MSISLSKASPMLNADKGNAVEPYQISKTDAAAASYLKTYKALYLGGEDTSESKMIRAATVISTHSEKEMALRLSNYKKVSTHLKNLTEEQLSTLLTTTNSIGTGTGGEIFSIKIGEVPVFVKKIRLTSIEEQNPRSTQNLFNLPAHYQYGVGSTGFGVWREIAAHEKTTGWVLNGESQNFPLMYHQRVLQRSTLPVPVTAEKLEDRRLHVQNWNGSESVRMQAEAADTASADIVVFMEHIPKMLFESLYNEENRGNLSLIEKELNTVVGFMKSRGFLHFDGHFANILTNNNHVYFADFGLAMHQDFDFSPEERAFFNKHRDYDRFYVAAELAKVAVAPYFQGPTPYFQGTESEELWNNYYSTEKIIITLPTDVASIAKKYRSIAILMETFLADLRKSKSTPYPEVELAREWAKL